LKQSEEGIQIYENEERAKILLLQFITRFVTLSQPLRQFDCLLIKCFIFDGIDGQAQLTTYQFNGVIRTLKYMRHFIKQKLNISKQLTSAKA
jgi:hypothetical protein